MTPLSPIPFSCGWFGGMYSSNEYESLELEPKLLISVSALFYPKRSMVWSRCNGWGWSRRVWGFCAQLEKHAAKRWLFSGWCVLNNASGEVIRKNTIQTKCKWTNFMTVLNFFTVWPELDNGNRYFWTSNPMVVCGSLECSIYTAGVGHQLPWINSAVGQLSPASWMDELPGYACNVSRFTGSYIYFMSGSGAVFFICFP